MTAPATWNVPPFAMSQTTREETEAHEQFSAIRDRLTKLVAPALPFINRMEEALRSASPTASVVLEILPDTDWKVFAPTLVLTYSRDENGVLSPAILEARDKAMDAWYNAPPKIRASFPPLRESITSRDE